MQVPTARVLLTASAVLLLSSAPVTSYGDLLKDLAEQLVKKTIEEVQRDEKKDGAGQASQPDERNDRDANVSVSDGNEDHAGAMASAQKRSIPLPQDARPITLDYLDGAIVAAPSETGVFLPNKFEMKVGEIGPGAFGSFPQASFSDARRFFLLAALKDSPGPVPVGTWTYAESAKTDAAWAVSAIFMTREKFSEFFTSEPLMGRQQLGMLKGRNEFEVRRSFEALQAFFPKWYSEMLAAIPDLPVEIIWHSQSGLSSYDFEKEQFAPDINVPQENAEQLLAMLDEKRRLYSFHRASITGAESQEPESHEWGRWKWLREQETQEVYLDESRQDLLGVRREGSFSFAPKYAYLAGPGTTPAEEVAVASSGATQPASMPAASGFGAWRPAVSPLLLPFSLRTFDGLPILSSIDGVYYPTMSYDEGEEQKRQWERMKLLQRLARNPGSIDTMDIRKFRLVIRGLEITSSRPYCNPDTENACSLNSGNEFETRRFLEQARNDLREIVAAAPDAPAKAVTLVAVSLEDYDFEAGGFWWGDTMGTWSPSYFGFIPMSPGAAETFMSQRGGRGGRFLLKVELGIGPEVWTETEKQMGYLSVPTLDIRPTPQQVSLIEESPRRVLARRNMSEPAPGSCLPAGRMPPRAGRAGTKGPDPDQCVPSVLDGTVAGQGKSGPADSIAAQGGAARLRDIRPRLFKSMPLYVPRNYANRGDDPQILSLQRDRKEFVNYLERILIARHPAVLQEEPVALRSAYYFLEESDRAALLDACFMGSMSDAPWLPAESQCRTTPQRDRRDWEKRMQVDKSRVYGPPEIRGKCDDYRAYACFEHVRWAGSTEFEAQRARNAFSANWSSVIAANAPELPVTVAVRMDVVLGEYDFDQNAFPVSADLWPREISSSVSYATTYWTAKVLAAESDFLVPMAAGPAEALIGRFSSCNGRLDDPNPNNSCPGGLVAKKLPAVVTYEIRNTAYTGSGIDVEIVPEKIYFFGDQELERELYSTTLEIVPPSEAKETRVELPMGSRSDRPSGTASDRAVESTARQSAGEDLAPTGSVQSEQRRLEPIAGAAREDAENRQQIEQREQALEQRSNRERQAAAYEQRLKNAQGAQSNYEDQVMQKLQVEMAKANCLQGNQEACASLSKAELRAMCAQLGAASVSFQPCLNLDAE